MSEEAGSTPRVRRSGVGFPALPLSDAANAVKRAGAYGYKHPIDALAGYMNHSTTNSGAFRAKAAALRDYGLISGRGDVIMLTELAQAIAHPDSAATERDALRSAFFNAEVFAKLHDTVAKGVDLDIDHLGNAAVRTLGVSPASKTTFTESFVAGAILAGVAERVGERHIRLLARGNAPASGAMGEPADGLGTDDAVAPSTTASPVVAASTPLKVPSPLPTVHQHWAVPSGTLTFEISYERPLPATVFPQIAKVVEECERLAGLLDSYGAVGSSHPPGNNPRRIIERPDGTSAAPDSIPRSDAAPEVG